MPPAELAGIVALAIVVVREAFSMVKNRQNGNGRKALLDRLIGIDGEIVRIREHLYNLGNELATLKGRCDLCETIRRSKE